MEQRVSLITLGVRDLERSRGFYEALGWVTRAAPDAGYPGYSTSPTSTPDVTSSGVARYTIISEPP